MGAKKKPVKKPAEKKAPAAKKPAPEKKPIAKKPTAPEKKTVAKKKPIAKKPAAKKKTAKKKTAGAKASPSLARSRARARSSPRSSSSSSSPSSSSSIPDPPASRPSERAMAVVAQLPSERPLTDEEREAMSRVALTALTALDVEGSPETVVARIGSFVDEVRAGERPEPQSQDVRLGLGVLWGEQIRIQVGWRWVHLSYPNGFASYALVPDDRAFACFPLNRVSELMTAGAGVNTSVPLFDSIRLGALPTRNQNAYLVIG